MYLVIVNIVDGKKLNQEWKSSSFQKTVFQNQQPGNFSPSSCQFLYMIEQKCYVLQSSSTFHKVAKNKFLMRNDYISLHFDSAITYSYALSADTGINSRKFLHFIHVKK